MPKSTSADKKKPTARQNATGKIARRSHTGETIKVPRSEKQRSQGRFPGETPLSGEDRPADRAGGKKQSRGPGSGAGRSRGSNAQLGARTTKR